MSQTIITEKELPSFRATHLDPNSVLKKLPNPDGVLLFDEPPGVGKTTLGRNLIPTALKRGFDLAIFVAPTRAIIDELLNDPKLIALADLTVVLEARPKNQCGNLNDQWMPLEKSGCAALAKEELCKSCTAHNTCNWPDQMDRITAETRVVVLTEQYLNLNPHLIPAIIQKVNASKPLVILDEALFVTLAHVIKIPRVALERFQEVLKQADYSHDLGERAANNWVQEIQFLLDDPEGDASNSRFFRDGLAHATLDVQHQGRAMFGDNYRHLVNDLSLLNSSVTTGQWQSDGSYEVAVKVDLGCAQAIVLAPNIEPMVVEERLERRVTVANPNFVFRHSGSRIVNISDGIGTARSMKQASKRKRVVDTFAPIVIGNALVGKRSVVVAKKGLLSVLGEDLKRYAEAGGFSIEVVLPGEKNSKAQDTWTVPFINFGIVGINALKDYDAIICLGAYNIKDEHLMEVYNQALPRATRHPFRIRTRDRRRTVEATNGCHNSRFHARRARGLLRTLERRIVIQAVGRARPFTSPTDVYLMQQDSFNDVFGEVQVFKTLGEFRSAFCIPTVAEFARATKRGPFAALRDQGASYQQIAEALSVSRSTAHKIINEPSLKQLLGGIGNAA